MKPLFAWLRIVALTLGLIPMLGASNTFSPPVVVVYPLTVSGGTDPEAGANVAVAIANRLATIGGITVKTYPPGTKRADYLTVALSLGADYYITGFLTPLGDQVTLVTQLVGTSSGSVISSSTALVRTYADATAQADLLGDAIIHHAGRALATLDRPVSTPAPKPEEKKNEANIGDLFKRKKKSTPAATPTATPGSASSPGRVSTGAAVAVLPLPTPARTATPGPTARPSPAPRTVAARNTPLPSSPPPQPTRAPSAAPAAQQLAAAGTLERSKLAASALVLNAAGGPSGDAAGYTQDAIVNAFQRSGATVAAVPVGAGDAVSRARELCASTFGARTVYAPTLSFDRNKNGDVTAVTLDLDAYDCGGSPTGRHTGRARVSGRGINGAIDNAATAAVSAFIFAAQQR